MFTVKIRNFMALVLSISLLSISSGLGAAGLIKTVVVKDFEQKYSGPLVSGPNSEIDLGKGMSDQLVNALVQSSQFIVLERQKSKSANTGKSTRAQIVIEGVITEFESSFKSNGIDFSFGGITFGNKNTEHHIGLIIRLIDSRTRQVIDSKRVEGKISSSDIDIGLDKDGVKFGTDSYMATPVGMAVQIAIDSAVEYIASRMRDMPFKGKVIKAKDTTLFINAGTRNGAQNGDKFGIYSMGEELIDPDTGEILGSDEVQLGTVKIFQAYEKYSKAKAIGNIMGAKVGDTVLQQ